MNVIAEDSTVLIIHNKIIHGKIVICFKRGRIEILKKDHPIKPL